MNTKNTKTQNKANQHGSALAYRSNTSILDNPDLIKVGQVLDIPNL